MEGSTDLQPGMELRTRDRLAAVRSCADKIRQLVARQVDVRLHEDHAGAGERERALGLLDPRGVLQAGGDALLGEIEDRGLLFQVVVGDIQQRVLQIKLDVGAHDCHGQRQPRRLAVRLGGRDP